MVEVVEQVQIKGFFGWVEKIGNKLFDLVFLFVYFIIVLIVILIICVFFGVNVMLNE